MMTFLDQVYQKRLKLADLLLDDEYSGIREIVEDLYPDRAHLIYELLQNAEDSGATEAVFDLRTDGMSFEHNGRPFNEADVWGITNIGKGTKRDKEDQIGRFGVGFKAVFAYSDSPHIWSPSFSFKITDLVLPSPLSPKPGLGGKTRFEFPFNSPKKAPDVAYKEIEAGFRELPETTLLFLQNLTSVCWTVSQGTSGKLIRVQHALHHVEMQKQCGRETSALHFLQFDEPVHGLEKQRVAVSFPLDFLPNVQRYDDRKLLNKQLRIVPAKPGQVSVYFPAKKEASGLRFHLHGPFVPELSRASIKDTAANQPLIDQLSTLTASSLHNIRDLGLLSGEFLAVLPNPNDVLASRYDLIRSAIVEEMNEKPLTPTHGKSHAPASQLIQARASLKDLLSKDDVRVLLGTAGDQWQWAIGATQRNSDVDRFLEGLAIRKWDTDQLVELLTKRAAETRRYIADSGGFVTGLDNSFMNWIAAKSLEWHQEFYALLLDHLSNVAWRKTQILNQIKSLHIIRLTDSTYTTPGKAFFPSDTMEPEELLPRVDPLVYTSGKSNLQRQNARKFLAEIGVREIGEAEQIEVILERCYADKDFRPRKKDLKRFVAFIETNPDKASLFAGSYIFELKDGQWGKPNQVFLDAPFKNTGLGVYYESVQEITRFPLAQRYQNGDISIARLSKFCEAVGVRSHLEIVSTTCYHNPDWEYLSSAGGDRERSPINQDYVIPDLETFLAKPSLIVARLVWNTMSALPEYPDYLKATYQKNARYGAHFSHSQLVHQLRAAAWIPQTDGSFVHPENADLVLLPEGFAFDSGEQWLKAIHFGTSLVMRSEEEKQKRAAAIKLGFPDDDSLERAKRFSILPAEEQERILAEHEFTLNDLSEHEPKDADRRARYIQESAAAAPGRRSEERTRSISVGIEAVKEQAAQYLRQQYTNPDGAMICQICKRRLPFDLDNGTPYFEKVEFLPDLARHHYQNYLALCPNHAAMYQHANGSRNSLRKMVAGLDGNELLVILAKMDVTIYITKTHGSDLKAVLRAEILDNRNQTQAVGPIGSSSVTVDKSESAVSSD